MITYIIHIYTHKHLYPLPVVTMFFFFFYKAIDFDSFNKPYWTRFHSCWARGIVEIGFLIAENPQKNTSEKWINPPAKRSVINCERKLAVHVNRVQGADWVFMDSLPTANPFFYLHPQRR